jgi:hypothetical protein
MNSIASLDLLMNQPSLIKDLEEITIVSSEMEQIYRWAEDSNRDSSRKFRAERAIKAVMSVYQKVFFSEEKNMAALLKSIFEDGTAATIITNNVINWSIANNYNIEISKYTINPNYYAGIYYELFKFENGYNEELEDILEGKTDYGLIENDFLIVKDMDQPITKENGDKDYAVNSIYRYHNGHLESIPLKQKIKNKYDTITSKNPEQAVLFELLNDETITILLTTGQFGTGKTFCLANYALKQLDEEKIKKIVYVPNNSFNENSREVGTLPGELFDKELIHLGCWVDLIGYDRLRDYVERGAIEIVPVSIARGRSFTDSIVLVNEAQNLTDKHIKLLVGRCGEGTRIFFDGDVKQADNDIFRDRSGLTLLTSLKNSPKFSRIFGVVKLDSIERSLTAQASTYLDSIE